MPSSTDQNPQFVPGSTGRRGEVFKRWNGRLHYFLGLYLLFFVWLYGFTGLLLNHSQWRFAEFWDSRQQTKFDRDIVSPASKGDLAEARDIMGQLGVRGEIEWTVTQNDASRFDFRVSRPGHIFDVKTDLARKKASVQRIDLNAWGVMRLLHTFTGVRLDDQRNQRDWVLTSVWALAMDAVAAGLILMVLSGLMMWYDARQNMLLGGIALLLGFLSCGLFCVGLRWLL
jgi:hypothetical protein